MVLSEQLKLITVKKKVIKGRLLKQRHFIERFAEVANAANIYEVETRLEALESYWPEYNALFCESILLWSEHEEDEAEAAEVEHSKFEDDVCQVKALFNMVIRGIKRQSQTGSENVHSPEFGSVIIKQEPRIKLPEIQLPKFDGKIEKWVEFRDSFDALVDNTQLPTIEKLLYLISCCKGGEAEAIVSGYEVNEANYALVYKDLKDRFDNKKFVVDKHFTEMLKCKPVNRDNMQDLKKLLNCYSVRIKQLTHAVPIADDLWNLLIVHLVSWRLDEDTRRSWETKLKKEELPTWKKKETFLEEKCRVLDQMSFNCRTFPGTRTTYSKPNNNQIKPLTGSIKPTTSLIVAQNNPVKCRICQKEHLTFNCEVLKSMKDINERVAKVREKNLCLNCLNIGHQVANCLSNKTCRECNLKHHTLLHFTKSKANEPKVATNHVPTASNDNLHQAVSKADKTVLSACSQQVTKERSVLLATAIVKLSDKSGSLIPCRALLDSGSESCFVTERMVQQLGLRKSKTSVKVTGLGNEEITSTAQVIAQIHSLASSYKESINCLVVQHIANNIPSRKLTVPLDVLPSDIQLADPSFHYPNKIDMIIGAELFWNIVRVNRRVLIPDQLFVVDTELGWVVYGKCTDVLENSNNIQCLLSVNQQLSQQVQRLWEVENVENIKSYSNEENHCEQLFVSSTKKNTEGRFVVRLPVKTNLRELQSNRKTAVRRLYQLEKRLMNDPVNRERYNAFMNEYEKLGHMIEVNVNENSPDARVHYLPHHHVIKLSSTTTKLRVVFNASCKAYNGLSLNDVLCVGPVVQEELMLTMLRFTQSQIAVIADVQMMYRQVNVDPIQTHMQRIVWRKSPDEPIKDFALQTITYGTAPASFLATRCLQQIGIDNRMKYSKASEIVESRFYMDDLLCGFDNIEEGLTVQKQIIEILSEAKFHLRKWASNDARMLEYIKPDDREAIDLRVPTDFVKTLGLCWKPNTDKFSYSMQEIDMDSKITKRTIMSSVAKWFDPLGKINPVVLIGKILIQKLWLLKADWDDKIPKDIEEFWIGFRNSFVILKEVEFDRCVIIPNAVDVEIHGFSDASEAAYGTCFYIRSKDSDGRLKVQLFCAKSKVAPVQQQTLPKLELLGAELMADLYVVVRKAINYNVSNVYLWSDSTIVLSWLKMPYPRLQTFVRNRVSKIEQLTQNCTWRHVNSQANPADYVSRGLTPGEILNATMWWHGPEFLQKAEIHWPKNPIHRNEDTLPEIKAFVVTQTNQEPEFINKFSSISKIKRIACYVLRFVNKKSPQKTNKEINEFSAEELANGFKWILKLIQYNSFNMEVKALRANKELNKKSKLKMLSVFLDDDGLIRVGGRLRHAQLKEDHKHPIVLPAHHHFVGLLVRAVHQQNLHCGQRALLSFVRQEFWPLQCKSIVRKVVHACVHCFRAKPKAVIPYMGDLPPSRVQLHHPFYQTGVDFAGPVHLKFGGPRSKTTTKAYLCIFVCMATKAIHLEVVSSLSSEAFLAALDRFFARRGISKHIHSDNGTNFVGACSELRAIYQVINGPDVQNAFNQDPKYEQIQWHFIPPRAPNFGGLWESAVKSVKHHLIRVIGQQLLSFEEMTTVLNSRPLSEESDDPNDLRVLTPAHFLIGRPLNERPQLDVNAIPVNRLNRWQITQRISQDFWKRFNVEYLHQLQQRGKWFNKVSSVKVGSLVLIKEDNLPPLKWLSGRVTIVHPGLDDVVRVVTVLTKNGEYKRPISKICLLPIED